MKFIKLTTFFFISLFIFSSYTYTITAASPDNSTDLILGTSSSTTQSSDRPILDKIMQTIFDLGSLTFGFPWFHQEFIPPSFYKLSPQVIDLQYLNQTEIEIAEIWPDGTVKKAVFEPEDTREGKMQRYLFASQYYNFELIQPDNSATSGMWAASFQPNNIGMLREEPKEGEEIPLIKTKLKLTLNLPPDAKYPQEDTNLQIKITRLDGSGNLWIPPNFPPYNKISSKLFWLVGAATTWGKYSGTVEEIVSFVNITVRVGTFHKAEIIPPSPIQIGPNELISVPVKVKNLGTRIDTFNFRVKTDKEGLILSAPSAITLKPGEEADVFLGVSSPRGLTNQVTYPVTIEMYSIDQPENVFSNTVTITTKGVYVSGASIFYSVIFFAIVILVILFFWFRRKRVIDRRCKKPEKPWNLPENKEKLEKLKEKDGKKYNQTLKKMEKDYEKELSTYKENQKEAIKKIREEKKNRSFDLFKKQEKIGVEKTEEMPQAVEEKPVEPQEEIIQEPQMPMPEEEKTPSVETKVDVDKYMKEQAIQRTLRDQEKQRKKLKR